MTQRNSFGHEYELFVEQAIEDYKESVPRSVLLAIGDEAVSNLSAESHVALTELLLCEEIDRLLFRRLELPSFREWRYRHSVGLQESPTGISSSGEPIRKAASGEILVLAEQVSEELVVALSRNPDLMHELSPRKFEELIAELIAREGADVSLTPISRDGGRDIVAKISTSLGSFLCLIECKKYSPARPVGVKPVRELYGVISHERVTHGVLVTSSRFTSPAREFAERVPHQLSLKAYSDIVSWLGAVSEDIRRRRSNDS